VTNNEDNLILRAIIAVLALADGVLHFSLDLVLFRGNFFGTRAPAGPPPGAAPGRVVPPPGARPNPFILPLNELFLLNFVGAVVLVVLFWFSRRWLGSRRWWVNIVMILYAAAAFVAWLIIGRPNPMGLGYLSKSIEIILMLALVADTLSILRPRVMSRRGAYAPGDR
jgi:hypothetical protein